MVNSIKSLDILNSQKILIIYDYYNPENYLMEKLELGRPESIEVRPEEVEETVLRVIEGYKRFKGRHYFLLIIPNDGFRDVREGKTLEELFRMIGDLKEISLDLSQEEFIESVLRLYVDPRIKDDVIKEIAKKISEKYRNGGYTIVDKYAGLHTLGISHQELEDLLEKAEGDALKFLKLYIEKLMFSARGSSPRRVRAIIPTLLIHVLCGEHPEELGEEFSKFFNKYNRLNEGEIEESNYLRSIIYPFLSEVHEEIVEQAIKSLFKEIVNGKLYNVNEELKAYDVRRHIHDISSKLSELKGNFEKMGSMKVDLSPLEPLEKVFNEAKGKYKTLLDVLIEWSGNKGSSFSAEELLREILAVNLRDFVLKYLNETGEDLKGICAYYLAELIFRASIRQRFIMENHIPEGCGFSKYFRGRELNEVHRLALLGYPTFINGVFREVDVNTEKMEEYCKGLRR